MSHCILIVHPDASTRSLMFSMLQAMGHRLEEADSTESAIRCAGSRPVQLALVGLGDDASEGLNLIDELRRSSPSTRVLLFAATPRPELLREFTMRGALGCLRFPLPATQLRAAVAQGLPDAPLTFARPAPGVMSTNGAYLAPAPALQLAGVPGMTPLVNGSREAVDTVCEDATFRKVLDLAEALAMKRSPFLITGERGSGRCFLARTLHAKSPWRDGPFLIVSCAAHFEEDPDGTQQIEALFGKSHPENPALDEPGLIARAAGGTLFLDDLQDLSPALQSMLLRVVRDGEYQPVHSPRVHRLECRLILGSCEDLGVLVDQGQFRSDLFYALSAVTLKIPPLRHRGNDILKLAEHFRERFAREAGKSIVGISAEATRRLTSHDWPRNISELKTVVERAVGRCRGHWIEPNHLDLEIRDLPNAARRGQAADSMRQSILPLKEALEEPERKLILEALRALNWNRQETARVLDINRTTLYKKMKKYGLVFEEAVWSN